MIDKTHAHLDVDLQSHHDPLSKISEAYKIARTNIEFAMIDSELKTINITSTQQTEGKSITIANLAVSYAQAGRRILLIDADLRRPSQHRRFALSNRQGLSTAIVHGSNPETYVQDSRIHNLSIMTSGPIPPNPAELLMSKTMWRLIDELKPQYDLIFLDGAPVGVVTDSAIISSKVDGTIFVVRAGQVAKKPLLHATEMLKKVNARVLGFVLNGANKQTDDYYQYYYYQEYYNQESSAPKKRRNQIKANENAHRYQDLQKSFRTASQPAAGFGEFRQSRGSDSHGSDSFSSGGYVDLATPNRVQADVRIQSEAPRKPMINFDHVKHDLQSEDD